MHKLHFAFLAFFISGLIASSVDFAFGQEKKIIISSGASGKGNVFSKIEKPFEEETGILLDFTDSLGTIACLKDVESGRAELGVAAIHWDAWKAEAREKKVAVANFDEIKQRVIGNDEVKIMTYPGGPTELNDAQLIGLLTGKITNWKQITGKEDLPVKFLMIPTASGTNKFVSETLLKGGKIREDGTMLKTNSERQETVLKTPGAFFFGNRTLVTPGMNIPKHRTIGRPITAIWKGKPSENLQKLLAYIKDKG